MSNLRLDCARWCQTAVQLAAGLESDLDALSRPTTGRNMVHETECQY